MPPATADNAASTETIREEQGPVCESITSQRVTIEIRAGSSGDAVRRGTEKYSRGPYRVTECLRCEWSTTSRIDNR
jgi:hypothetical protein